VRAGLQEVTTGRESYLTSRTHPARLVRAVDTPKTCVANNQFAIIKLHFLRYGVMHRKV